MKPCLLFLLIFLPAHLSFSGCKKGGSSPPNPGISILPPIQNPNATALSGRRVRLDWSFAHTSNNPQAGMGILRLENLANFWTVVGSTALSQNSFLDDVDLQPGNTYRYKVLFYDDPDKVEVASEEVEVTTPSVNSAPLSPDQLVLTPASWHVDLSWQDNSSDEDGFRIERSEDGINFFVLEELAPNVTSYRDPLVQEDEDYYYRISAFNNVGASPPTPEVQVLTGPSQATLLPEQLYTGDFHLTEGEYLAQGHIVYDDLGNPDHEFTMDPGVEIRFKSDTHFNITGKLIAQGTQEKPIHLSFAYPDSSKHFPTEGGIGMGSDWQGLHLGGAGSKLSHVEVLMAESGIRGGAGIDTITDSILSYNKAGIGHLSGDNSPLRIVRTSFRKNWTGILLSASKEIFYSSFRGNQSGASLHYGFVKFSVVEGNGSGIGDEGVLIQGCLIANNSGYGIFSNDVGPEVRENTITKNGIGIEPGNTFTTTPGILPITKNNLFGNSTFNLEYTEGKFYLPIDLTQNWWGTTDPAQIEAGIYDCMDDPDSGCVTYNPFLSGPINSIPSLP